MPTDEHRCRNCRNCAKPTEGALWGKCRRFPPTIVPGFEEPQFPEVHSSWWCGEYVPAPQGGWS